ncbi:MAG TPA: DUF3168 domain-containing protein [Anaerolineae bacterium]|nr:DUF3168 domain-containing protein [Anaerolineae bacterium]
MSEPMTAERWLYTLLSGDATLQGLIGDRVYSGEAPTTAAYPLVLIVFQGGHDVLGVGPARIMAQCRYLVKAVGATPSYAALEPIASRIDALLQGASGSVTSGLVLACVREAPVVYPEQQEGKVFRHLGGIYRIVAQ